MMNTTSIISQSETIINDYYTKIYRYCFMKVFDAYVAQDIVQDVFIRFFQRFDRYHEETKIKEILFSIAHNLCVDYFRKYGKHKEVVYEEEYYQLQDTKQEIERNITMHSFIQLLDVNVRETILLYYYYEFRIKDISHVMNTSESNVKYRLKSGRDKLKEIFDKEDIPYEDWFR